MPDAVKSPLNTLTQEVEAQPLEHRAVFWGDKFSELIKSEGITKDELSAITKISRYILEAFLMGEFDKLPNQTLGRGFLKTICRELNSESEELLSAYDLCWRVIANNEGQSKFWVRINKNLQKKSLFSRLFLVDLIAMFFKKKKKYIILILILLILSLHYFTSWRILSFLDKSFLSETTQSSLRPKQTLMQKPQLGLNKSKEKTKLQSDYLSKAKDSDESFLKKGMKLEDKGSLNSISTQKPSEEGSLHKKLKSENLSLELSKFCQFKIRIDQGKLEEKSYQPGKYHFLFKEKLVFLPQSCSKGTLTYASRPLDLEKISNRNVWMNFIASEKVL